MEPTITTPVTKSNRSQWITPIAIIIAGILIAVALYYRSPDKTNTGADAINNALTQPKIEVEPVKSTDHIRGSKDADIVFIEYSDIECPFCQLFQQTMINLYSQYSKDNKIAWVYRHFPLAYGANPLHENADKAAEATECVAEIAGEDAFWKYIDKLYASIDHDKGPMELKLLTDIAVQQGVDQTKFTACLNSGKYEKKIKESYEAGLKAGAEGTPYTVLYYKDQYIPLVNEQGKSLGALPFEILKRIADELLAKK
jgi:protein-disulfide isomerase